MSLKHLNKEDIKQGASWYTAIILAIGGIWTILMVIFGLEIIAVIVAISTIIATFVIQANSQKTLKQNNL